MISALRAKRLLMGLTLYDVWVTSGIDPARLSLVERGFKQLRDDEIPKLARALRCNPKELIRGQGVHDGEV